MKYEGKIILNEDGKVIFDAEPHVMSRVRKIFDNSTTFYIRGEYTHKPISFPLTLSGSKDIIWLMSRYNLSISEDLLSLLTGKSKEYDDIINTVNEADKDGVFRPSQKALKLNGELRDHQIKFLNMFSKVKRMLLADKMGLGKTISAISTLLEPESRPAIIIVPPTLCTQWEREVNRFLPGVKTHVIRGFKTYDISNFDVIITSYNRLRPWQDEFFSNKHKFNTLIMDEVHELRHTNTEKRRYCQLMSERVNRCLGLSGTPIFNQGGEIWSVLDVIKPGCLGDSDEFHSEWCNWGKVYEPSTLNAHLKKMGVFLRRTPEDIGLKFGEASKHIYTIDSDINKLKEVQNVAKMLALSVLSGNAGEDSESAREFDWKLRHATGVAKAKAVAEFVKLLVEQGEKVLLTGWHRDFWDIVQSQISGIKSVMFTGAESVKEKDEAVKSFIEGDAQIFMISLRSGAGIDGLQRVCNNVVIGELDWSPHVMDQIVARLDRDGQTKHVNAYYLTVADGADPFMIQTLGIKRSQHDGVIEGKEGEGQILAGNQSGSQRIKDMAAQFLASIGEEIPEMINETGLLADIVGTLRRSKITVNSEAEMQDALSQCLSVLGDKVEKEYKISKRSRIDFMATDGTEKIGIECKINSTDRKGVYRQVKRYIEEGQFTSMVIVAPWHGIPSFKVDNIPVLIIDPNVNAI